LAVPREDPTKGSKCGDHTRSLTTRSAHLAAPFGTGLRFFAAAFRTGLPLFAATFRTGLRFFAATFRAGLRFFAATVQTLLKPVTPHGALDALAAVFAMLVNLLPPRASDFAHAAARAFPLSSSWTGRAPLLDAFAQALPKHLPLSFREALGGSAGFGAFSEALSQFFARASLTALGSG
jgi:hypothetical protein